MKYMLKAGKSFFFKDAGGQLRSGEPGQVYDLTPKQAQAWSDQFEPVPEGGRVVTDQETGRPVVTTGAPVPPGGGAGGASTTSAVKAAAVTATNVAAK